jgi:hypothetical protein
MIGHSAGPRIVLLGMGLLALAGSLGAVTEAVAQTSVPMEFPPPGTRWITRSIDQAGEGRLSTYTVLEPGSYQGRSGFRVSDGIGVQFFERGERNWFATVHREKERSGPHSGTFAWPLEVGKSWSSVYQYRDNQRNVSFNRVTSTWRGRRGRGLRAAQRAAMKEFPHPFAWAAFGLTGVGR